METITACKLINREGLKDTRMLITVALHFCPGHCSLLQNSITVCPWLYWRRKFLNFFAGGIVQHTWDSGGDIEKFRCVLLVSEASPKEGCTWLSPVREEANGPVHNPWEDPEASVQTPGWVQKRCPANHRQCTYLQWLPKPRDSTPGWQIAWDLWWWA